MKNYREAIYRLSKETVAEAFDRFANSLQFVKVAQENARRPKVLIDYDKERNIRVLFNNNMIFEIPGKSLWKDVLLELRKKKVRGEFGERPMFIVRMTIRNPKTGEETIKQYDATNEVEKYVTH
jgi:hypothetical protein